MTKASSIECICLVMPNIPRISHDRDDDGDGVIMKLRVSVQVGGMVVRWVSLASHCSRVPGLILTSGYSLRRVLHFLPPPCESPKVSPACDFPKTHQGLGSLKDWVFGGFGIKKS